MIEIETAHSTEIDLAALTWTRYGSMPLRSLMISRIWEMKTERTT